MASTVQYPQVPQLAFPFRFDEPRETMRRTACDVAAGSIAAALVSPFVAAVDKAIAMSASGQANVWSSLRASCHEMVASPLAYLRAPAFRYLWIMYGGTYAAANTFNSYEEVSRSTQPLAKTSSIFLVNSSLSLWKDAAFARLFGGKPPAPVPIPAYLSWWSRDFISMGVIFVAPPIAARQLHEHAGISEKKAEVISQLALPLMLQPFVAPLHLYGYVAYNKPDASRTDQLAVMRKEILGAVQMRVLRCIPPYCLGAVANRSIRRSLLDATA
eukprot:CAMPEP_0169066122 /NCGR_PEP_ID=MMETSP1015-20121227/2783_1 /TAXON_ID=342587 /ORGANISM="Karlodinium micrum, Strain CCMP2283" /LENGTH=271 /DNA_ID=CAMNT_0009124771 /DNA_START=63 /DNA_END=878 /DNA_ORIENTATION=+